MASQYIYHYVYRITNLVENKHYYGKRSSKCDPKLDLGVKYFSSSRDKEFLIDQKNNPQNYKYKIVGLFSTNELAFAREIRLHAKFNCAVSEKFYNRANSRTSKFSILGTKSSIETRQKISRALKGKCKSAEHIKNANEAKRKAGTTSKGSKLTQEHKNKISKAHKGRKRSAEQIQNYIVSRIKANKARGKQLLSQEHKNAIASALKGQPKSVKHIENMSGESHHSFIGYYVSPDLTTPTITKQTKLGITLGWYSNLDKLISKCSYRQSKYLNTRWTWDEIQNKTYRDIGINFIPSLLVEP